MQAVAVGLTVAFSSVGCCCWVNGDFSYVVCCWWVNGGLNLCRLLLVG